MTTATLDFSQDISQQLLTIDPDKTQILLIQGNLTCQQLSDLREAWYEQVAGLRPSHLMAFILPKDIDAELIGLERIQEIRDDCNDILEGRSPTSQAS